MPEPIDPVDSVCDDSVDQDSSSRPGNSVTSSLVTSIAGSPDPTTSVLLGINSPEVETHVLETTLRELDQEFIVSGDVDDLTCTTC